ncbi:MAG TPA: universal stress protein [Thermomicrobiales bacterium]|jgi:nucleotide-binding universal stress UspA family protein
MTTALICVRGYRVAALLDAAANALSSDLTWIVLHVVDTRPLHEVDRALGGLPVHGPGRHRVEDRLQRAAQEQDDAVKAEVAAWLHARGRDAEVVVSHGRPEQEILRLADARGIDLIALGSEHPGVGPHPLSPPVRFLIDHAKCDVLLLRRYAT